MSRLMPIEGVVRDYPWGSRTALPQMLGLVATGDPMAELWLGAHPDDPATVVSSGEQLDKLIASDPLYFLGDRSQEHFGDRLPYLLKVLAIDKALSIQVHPSRIQAEHGFRGQAGISGANLNYTDDNHKPELICALTQLTAFCGFRPVSATLTYLRALQARADLPELDELADILTGADGLRAAMQWLLDTVDTSLSERIAAACAQLGSSDSPYAAAAAATALGATDFPGDVGVGVSLLLNMVTLAPGEAIFLAAGNIHAYVRGVGVEIMANSDNVVRCGFTGKHIDVAEVMRIADFTPLDEPRLQSVCRDGVDYFDVPVADFRLGRVPAAGTVVLPAGMPRVVLCVSGSVECTAVDGVGVDGVDAEGVHLRLTRGEAGFVPASVALSLHSDGEIFVAEPGL